MKKILYALVLSLLVWDVALADNFMFEEETNAYGYADKELITVIENRLSKNIIDTLEKPECNDRNLINQAQEALRPYTNEKALSIVEKRKVKLVLKNVDNFETLDIADVSPKKHRIVASRLIELKINNHLSDENIKICQSDNPVLDDKLYLVIYDDLGKIRVDIVNFADTKIPSFIFNTK